MYQQTHFVEAGLPSGTFSTADAALAAGRDVLVVPGAITSPSSRGANRLLLQGAFPVVALGLRQGSDTLVWLMVWLAEADRRPHRPLPRRPLRPQSDGAVGGG